MSEAKQIHRGLWSQPVVGIGAAALAGMVVAVSWINTMGVPGSAAGQPANLLLALCLVAATVAAYQFPIHIIPKTKIYMASVPYYLMAVLLPPPLAATAAGLAALSGEASVQTKRGTTAGQIAAETGRRMLIVLLGALVAHLPGETPLRALAWVAAAVILEGGDIATFPLILVGMSKDPPLRLIIAAAREAYLMEAAQYVLAMLGALAVTRQVWALAIVAAATALVYLILRALRQSAAARRPAESTQHMAQ